MGEASTGRRRDSGPEPLGPHAWLAYLVPALLVAIGAQIMEVVPTTPVLALVVASSVVAVFEGLRRHQPGWSPVWRRFLLGFGFYVVASLLWLMLEPSGLEQLLPLAVHTLGFAFLFAGLVRLVRLRTPGGDRAGMIDALIVTVAAGVAGWMLALQPIATDVTVPAIERFVAVSYPLMDLAMLPVMVRLLTGGGRQTVALQAVIAALTLAIGANFVYAYLAWRGDPLDWLALVYPLGFALTASAALHPSVAALDSPRDLHDGPEEPQIPPRPLTRRRFAALVAVSLAVPVLALEEWLRGEPAHVAVVSVGTIVVFVLVAIRLWGLVRDVEALTVRQGERRLRRELAHQAKHDPVTGLPSRAVFLDRVRDAARDESCAAVLLVDIDDFKTFNDSFGHAAGDEVLRRVAERLLQAVRAHDLAARLGSDEFALLLRVEHAREADAVAERIRTGLQAPVEVDQRRVVVRASIGVAVGEAGSMPEDLLRHADAALNAARARGKGELQRYDPRLLHHETRRRTLTAALRRAIEGELWLAYQPIVDLEHGDIVGAEALLRWHHPQLGPVGPFEFIPLAEETGLIVPIGAWVLRTACAEASRWHDRAAARGRPWTLTINLSVVQLREPGLVEDVRAALEQTGLPPHGLTLEVTESVLAGDDTAQCLADLRRLGVGIAVDDFGTGYSSLRYLQRFPLDVLKIDRGFVEALEHDQTLARVIIGLANALQLRTIAEGIETRQQAELLRGLACDLGQGYLFARPMAGDALERSLTTVSQA